MRFLGLVFGFVVFWANLFTALHTARHVSHHTACHLCAASDQLDKRLKETDIAFVSVSFETAKQRQEDEEKAQADKPRISSVKPHRTLCEANDSRIVIPCFIPIGYHATAPPYRFV